MINQHTKKKAEQVIVGYLNSLGILPGVAIVAGTDQTEATLPMVTVSCLSMENYDDMPPEDRVREGSMSVTYHESARDAERAELDLNVGCLEEVLRLADAVRGYVNQTSLTEDEREVTGFHLYELWEERSDEDLTGKEWAFTTEYSIICGEQNVFTPETEELGIVKVMIPAHAEQLAVDVPNGFVIGDYEGYDIIAEGAPSDEEVVLTADADVSGDRLVFQVVSSPIADDTHCLNVVFNKRDRSRVTSGLVSGRDQVLVRFPVGVVATDYLAYVVRREGDDVIRIHEETVTDKGVVFDLSSMPERDWTHEIVVVFL